MARERRFTIEDMTVDQHQAEIHDGHLSLVAGGRIPQRTYDWRGRIPCEGACTDPTRDSTGADSVVDF